MKNKIIRKKPNQNRVSEKKKTVKSVDIQGKEGAGERKTHGKVDKKGKKD